MRHTMLLLIAAVALLSTAPPARADGDAVTAAQTVQGGNYHVTAHTGSGFAQFAFAVDDRTTIASYTVDPGADCTQVDAHRLSCAVSGDEIQADVAIQLGGCVVRDVRSTLLATDAEAQAAVVFLTARLGSPCYVPIVFQ
jgi:hypothetical protein